MSMDLAQAAAEYMAGIAPRFEKAGYALHANVPYEEGVFAGVARREKGEVLRLEKTPLWGAAYRRGLRKTIQELLPPPT